MHLVLSLTQQSVALSWLHARFGLHVSPIPADPSGLSRDGKDGEVLAGTPHQLLLAALFDAEVANTFLFTYPTFMSDIEVLKLLLVHFVMGEEEHRPKVIQFLGQWVSVLWQVPF